MNTATTTMTLEQALAHGQHALDSGRLTDAETLYWGILSQIPNQPDALLGLGRIALRQQQPEAAESRLNRALAAVQGQPATTTLKAALLATLGQALWRLGCPNEARFQWRQSLTLDAAQPDVAEWLTNGLPAPVAPDPDSQKKGSQKKSKGKDKGKPKNRNQANPPPVISRPVVASAPSKPAKLPAVRPAPVLTSRPASFTAIVTLPDGRRLQADRALDEAQRAYQAGQLDAAAEISRAVLELLPDHLAALNLIGAVHYQRGELTDVEHYLERSLALEENALHYNNLAGVQQAQGKLDEAEANLKRALELTPDYADALKNLGILLATRQRYADAIPHFQRLVEVCPDAADDYCSLGKVLFANGQPWDAIANFCKALNLQPTLAEAHCQLGNALMDRGQGEEAEPRYRQAIALAPDYADAHYQLGDLLLKQRRHDDAMACFERVLELNPNDNRGLTGMAGFYQRHGDHEQALEYYQRALNLIPDNPGGHAGMLFSMNYAPGKTPQDLYEEHRRFAERFETPLKAQWRPHPNDRDPERRLRIGYVSGDFRKHSVAFFLEPVLARHDHGPFEIFCYSSCTLEMQDAVTARFKDAADHWREVAKLTDDEVADLIREDQIDILVDLAGVTAYNRLLVFARKPAPVQATWLGYPSTTGLNGMDYCIVDHYTHPPGMEAIHSEALCRLPGVFMAFQPPQESPEVSELPALDGRPLTFGCFNNFAKVTPNVIALWAQLLEAIPNSRLLLKNGDFANLKHQAKVREQFASHGIPADRLLFSGADAGQHEHLLWYHQVDIGLDPFPYNGATTTCDTLWMGVPVVALAGDRFLGRIGASLLNNSGLSDLVAETPEEYIAIAVRLANDLPGLADLRRRLRAQVAVAPIMDALRFTRTLENAYRAMWQLWCADPDFDFAQRTPLIVPPPDEAALQVPVTQRLPAPEAAETGQDSDSMGSEAVEAIAAVAAIAQGAPAPTLAPPAIKLMIRGMPMTLTQALQRGYEWLRVGELEAAEEVYQAVVEAVPEHADAWNRLGGIYYQRGDFAKAEEYLARAVECFGDHPQFHNNLAIARLMLGKPDQAEASCRRALALKPDYVEALNNMGAALEAQSRFTSAAKHYKRVLEFEPFFAEGHYNLGNALRGAGRVDEAIESYRKALELRPRDAKTLHQLGTVWQALGGYGKEAEECFTLARKLEAETEVA